MSLVDKRYIFDLIPFILCEEKVRIKSEIADKHVWVIFDGTSLMDQLLKQFGDIVLFLNNDDVSSATAAKLLETMVDVAEDTSSLFKRSILQLEFYQ